MHSSHSSHASVPPFPEHPCLQLLFPQFQFPQFLFPEDAPAFQLPEQKRCSQGCWPDRGAPGEIEPCTGFQQRNIRERKRERRKTGRKTERQRDATQGETARQKNGEASPISRPRPTITTTPARSTACKIKSRRIPNLPVQACPHSPGISLSPSPVPSPPGRADNSPPANWPGQVLRPTKADLYCQIRRVPTSSRPFVNYPPSRLCFRGRFSVPVFIPELFFPGFLHPARFSRFRSRAFPAFSARIFQPVFSALSPALSFCSGSLLSPRFFSCSALFFLPLRFVFSALFFPASFRTGYHSARFIPLSSPERLLLAGFALPHRCSQCRFSQCPLCMHGRLLAGRPRLPSGGVLGERYRLPGSCNQASVFSQDSVFSQQPSHRNRLAAKTASQKPPSELSLRDYPRARPGFTSLSSAAKALTRAGTCLQGFSPAASRPAHALHRPCTCLANAPFPFCVTPFHCQSDFRNSSVFHGSFDFSSFDFSSFEKPN